jgi:hypothetical protein
VEAGAQPLRVDWPVYPRRADHNTVAGRGNTKICRRVLKPDQALALVAGLGLVADTAELASPYPDEDVACGEGGSAGRSVGPAANPQNGTSEGPAAASPPARNTPSRQAGRLIPTTCVRAAGTANAARRGRQPFLPSRARGRHVPQTPRDSNSPVLLDETGSAADVFARHRCSRTHQDLNLAIRQYSKQPETEPSTKVAKPGVALTSPKSFSRLTGSFLLGFSFQS